MPGTSFSHLIPKHLPPLIRDHWSANNSPLVACRDGCRHVLPLATGAVNSMPTGANGRTDSLIRLDVLFWPVHGVFNAQRTREFGTAMKCYESLSLDFITTNVSGEYPLAYGLCLPGYLSERTE